MLAALPVEGAAARDRDVLLLPRIDERRIVHELDAFPAREHDGVARWIGVELERRTLGDVQIHVALEVNRTREERQTARLAAARHDDPSSTRRSARVDRLRDRAGRERLAVRHRAVFPDVEIAIRKLRRLDVAHDVLRTVPGFGRRQRVRDSPCHRKRGGAPAQDENSTIGTHALLHSHSPARCRTISRGDGFERCSKR
jgi:hypothetical protein